MKTSNVHRWKQKPGSFDVLHTNQLFRSDNEWGIPVLRHTAISRIPAWLAPYRQRIRSHQPPADGAIHFFVDDYRFETVWNRPYKALTALRPFSTLLTPDFSLYRDWPMLLQLWNTYRNRWCGAFWQWQGFTVIPSVSWGTAESYPFCFLGIPKRSVVAVGTVGVNLAHPLEQDLFLAGFTEMVARLEPTAVLCYGRAPAACHELAEVITYPTRWTDIRNARRSQQNGRTRQ